MNGLYRKLDACLLCGETKMKRVAALAPIPIATPNFSLPSGVSEEEALAGVPLDLDQCAACGHIQVEYVGNPEFQYRDYVYRTQLSPGLPEHFQRYGQALVDRWNLRDGDLAVEIGSNDGTLLRALKAHGLRVQGVDPARSIAQDATASGISTEAEFFSTAVAQALRERVGAASVIIANNMIANVHDLRDFTDGIAALLADDGLFVFETQYGADVIERMLLDTIYHEHLSYFMVTPTVQHFRRHSLEVIDVERVPTKGGSIRVTVQKHGAGREIAASVLDLVEREKQQRMFDMPFFEDFSCRIDALRSELLAVLDIDGCGAPAGYGVSVGTTALLAQFGLTTQVQFLVDDDAEKNPTLSGPGYEIPVLPPAALVDRAPRYTVIFAWRYADRIAAKNRAYQESGGGFIVPLPEVRRLPR